MIKFTVKTVQESIIISGETIGGNLSTGKFNIYLVTSEDGSWEVELAHTMWDNGEEEIVAKKVTPDRLHIIRNRLRMVINKSEFDNYPNAKWVTLRSAVLCGEANNEWANLHNISLGELSEYSGGNASKYFNKLGALTLDYKI